MNAQKSASGNIYGNVMWSILGDKKDLLEEVAYKHRGRSSREENESTTWVSSSVKKLWHFGATEKFRVAIAKVEQMRKGGSPLKHC
jgi:hypothetical protein